ncbi:AMP-binding enzyme [Desulfoscipio gibsoniae]|uniref:AMP-binding enzyme n=1 Tax=Desulfoscipio gibsoniae TaxID=102134 RepID=UPI000232AB47|nr:long-chain-fatty-acid--CoA ligase [Desulfoscipio gibsoniae]
MLNTLTPSDLVMHVRKLERAINKHPHVADAVVISFNTASGTRIKAFVEPADPVPTPESIRQFCYNDLVGELPVDFVFKSIPRTPSGKVIRQQLLNGKA